MSFDLAALWDAHCRHEFVAPDVDATMATMVEEPYVNNVPTMTGGLGYAEVRRFYGDHLIGATPTDFNLTPISRTIGASTLVDEMVCSFTHSCEMNWLLPGVAPTHRRVELPVIAVVQFRDDKVLQEHLYWDQASVLVQIGMLDPTGLPVTGAQAARKVLDRTLPGNPLRFD